MPAATKPTKPYTDFPLTANGNGQWSKKIDGRVHYFGRWDDPVAALAKYHRFLADGTRHTSGETVKARRAGRKSGKPRKPYPDFPLTPNGNGQWSKRIRGRVCYFGVWSDPDAALQKYLDERHYLEAGLTPPSRADGLPVGEACAQFLDVKRLKRDNGELTEESYQDYKRDCTRVVDALGECRLVEDLTAEDFAKLRERLNQTMALVAQGNVIGRIRSVFKFAYDQGLVDSPVRFGEAFRKPGKKTLKREQARNREANGSKMLEAAQIRALLAEATDPMRAFILLGINCAFGATDIAGLPAQLVDAALGSGWLDYARRKTSEDRRVWLWPETREAIRVARVARDGGDLAFRTLSGKPYARIKPNGARNDAVGEEFRKLLDRMGLKRRGLGHYALRHTFQTIAGETTDQKAVDLVMGHAKTSMSDRYVQRIADDRIWKVCEHVRAWLYAKADGDATVTIARHGLG